MKTKSLAVLLAVLPLAACMSSPPPAPAPAPGASLDQMSCSQLAAAESAAKSDAAWARRQQQQTFSNSAASDAGTLSLPVVGSGSATSPNSARAAGSQSAIRAAMAKKGCS